MKRYGNLYKKIYDKENIRLAHKNAKMGKGYYAEVKEVNNNLEKYIDDISSMLMNHTFHTSQYDVFEKKEGNKIRKIYKLPYYPDRIVQWAILQVIEKYLISNFISDTYSAIPGKGIHYGVNRIQSAIRNDKENCKYCLKIDIKHYYQSINHEILKRKYASIFKDKELLDLLYEIIDSVNTADQDDLYNIYTVLLEEDIDYNTGEPIGNYLSQYSANLYLSDFDHWIKEVKHEKHYYRYMDDIVILSSSKEHLNDLFKDIRLYMKDNLKLRIKDNYQIFPTYVRGVDFLGYRFFDGYTLLRKSTCKNFKKKMLAIQNKTKLFEDGDYITYSEYCSINSYRGWLKYCDSFRLEQKYLAPLEPYVKQFHDECLVNKNNKITNNSKERKNRMIVHYSVMGDSRPLDVDIKDSKVFVAKNIHEITVENIGENDEVSSHTAYEFDLYEYDKNEFLLEQANKTEELKQMIIDAHVAICDIYEEVVL